MDTQTHELDSSGKIRETISGVRVDVRYAVCLLLCTLTGHTSFDDPINSMKRYRESTRGMRHDYGRKCGDITTIDFKLVVHCIRIDDMYVLVYAMRHHDALGSSSGTQESNWRILYPSSIMAMVSGGGRKQLLWPSEGS